MVSSFHACLIECSADGELSQNLEFSFLKLHLNLLYLKRFWLLCPRLPPFYQLTFKLFVASPFVNPLIRICLLHFENLMHYAERLTKPALRDFTSFL